MKIDCRIIGDITIIDLYGKLTLGEGTMILRLAVKEALRSGSKKIILNMAEVNYIDPSGFGEMVSVYTTVDNLHGQVRLINLAKKIMELFQITKLLTFFNVYNSEMEAIASF